MTLRTPVYLDHNASTPTDPRVIEVMARALRDHPGNAASGNHAFGWAAAKLVARAREQVAGLIGAEPRELIFTSGATEADNLAVLGVAGRYPRPGHLVVSAFEHEAVAGPVAHLETNGWTVTRVRPDSLGIVDPQAIGDAIGPETVLVSVMAAQNEIGTVQSVAGIGRVCRERGILFHTDAAQAAGRVALDVQRDGVGMLALSAHKMYGPQGVGALYLSRREPRVTLEPVQFGGGQERGLRPGTLNVAGIAGFGEACGLAQAEMAAESRRLDILRRRLWSALSGGLDGVHLNGHPEQRLPGTLNVSFEGIRAHGLLGAVTRLAVSSGSACNSSESRPSAVLTGMGVSAELAAASLRIGLGRSTTVAEVDFGVEVIVEAVQRLRSTACAD